MTTDITELAQSMSLRKKLNRRLNDAYGFQRTSGGKHTTISLSIVECKSIIAALDEHLALVEALEKAQQERSDPVSGTTVAAGGLMGASAFGLAPGIDYGVVFGAFAGAVFYVATAANITRVRLIAYFMTSFIVGVLAAGLVGSKLSQATGYSDRPLDALGAVVVAAMTIKVLTFFNSQDLGSLFSILSRFRGGGASTWQP